MRTRKPLKLDTIPTWAIDDQKRDRYTVAAAFQLAELTGKWVRLTAETQRAVFGANLLGKCEMLVEDEGIKVLRTACYGTDFSFSRFDWTRFEEVMAEGRRPLL